MVWITPFARTGFSLCLSVILFTSPVRPSPGRLNSRRIELAAVYPRAPQESPSYKLDVKPDVRIRPYGQPLDGATPSGGSSLSPAPGGTDRLQGPDAQNKGRALA